MMFVSDVVNYLMNIAYCNHILFSQSNDMSLRSVVIADTLSPLLCDDTSFRYTIHYKIYKYNL
jgi:hypothetical protein